MGPGRAGIGRGRLAGRDPCHWHRAVGGLAGATEVNVSCIPVDLGVYTNPPWLARAQNCWCLVVAAAGGASQMPAGDLVTSLVRRLGHVHVTLSSMGVARMTWFLGCTLAGVRRQTLDSMRGGRARMRHSTCQDVRLMGVATHSGLPTT